jgi:hypothetical protein
MLHATFKTRRKPEIRKEEEDRGMVQVWQTEVRKGFWWGNLMERAHLETLGVDGRIKLKWILTD